MSKPVQLQSEDLPPKSSINPQGVALTSRVNVGRDERLSRKELRILLVEDCAAAVGLIEDELRRGEIVFSMARVKDEATFRKRLDDSNPDLVLSSLGVPGLCGSSALAIARECRPLTPFIFVSGMLGADEAVELLKQGATDYVRKENLSRLVPAILRALREAQLEMERTRAEEKYRSIFENAMAGIYQITPEGEILTLNPAMARIVGYDSPDALKAAGIVSFDRLYAEPSKRAELFSLLEEKGEVQNFEVQICRRDKTRTWISQSVRAVADPMSGCVYYEGFVEEITRRKELDAQMLRAQRMESIGTLACGLIHDLKNILSPILMSAPLLRQDLPPDKRELVIASLESSAERGAEIVRQVLSFGRGLEGKPEPLQLEDVVREVVKIIHGTFPKNIVLETEIADNLPLVFADATQLYQVILNLCVNARDAMPTGGKLRLAVRKVDVDSVLNGMASATPGSRVVLEVQDTGRGIPREILNQIFDPFFTTKPPGQGTGLGLSTALSIAQTHGGDLAVRTEINRGSTFTLTLPAVAGECSKKVPVPREDECPKGNGELVLIVDDEETIGACVKRILERSGYEVMLASDGAEALALFVQNNSKIAAVITDNLMPGIDGLALIRALRNLDPKLRIILSSGQEENIRVQEMNLLQVGDILRKPYNAGTLLRTLHGVLHPARNS